MEIVEINAQVKIEKRKPKIFNPVSERSKPGRAIIPVMRSLRTSRNVIQKAATSERVRLAGNEDLAASADIFVRENSCLKKIKSKDIYLIEGLCDCINIYTKEKRYCIYSTIYGILERLPKTDFMRVHKSYIVRIDRVSSIEDNRLSIEMRRIPVSKTYIKEVLLRLRP